MWSLLTRLETTRHPSFLSIYNLTVELFGKVHWAGQKMPETPCGPSAHMLRDAKAEPLTLLPAPILYDSESGSFNHLDEILLA